MAVNIVLCDIDHGVLGVIDGALRGIMIIDLTNFFSLSVFFSDDFCEGSEFADNLSDKDLGGSFVDEAEAKSFQGPFLAEL